GQVLPDVVVQGPEGRHVDDVDPLLEAALERQAVQVVEGPEEGRQRLAGSRRRDDQRVSTGRDRRPPLALGARRRPERLLEPAADEGQKRRERHGALIVGLRTRPRGCRRPARSITMRQSGIRYFSRRSQGGLVAWLRTAMPRPVD